MAVGGHHAYYQATQKPNANETIEEVKKSKLRGRGDAGYPTGVKWDLLRKAVADQKHIICNAAVDSARTSLRLGCDVTIAYRRKRQDMPAIPEGVIDAEAADSVTNETNRRRVERLLDDGPRQGRRARHVSLELAVDQRKGHFKEAMLGLTKEDAVAESSRCLRCDVHEQCACVVKV